MPNDRAAKNERQDGWYWARLRKQAKMQPYAWENGWIVGDCVVTDALMAEIGARIPDPAEPTHGPSAIHANSSNRRWMNLSDGSQPHIEWPAECGPAGCVPTGWECDGDLWICERCEIAFDEPTEHACKPDAATGAPGEVPAKSVRCPYCVDGQCDRCANDGICECECRAIR